MKFRMLFPAWLLGVAGFGGIAFAPIPSEAGEAKIKLEDIPDAVKATIRAEGGKIEDIERQEAGGKVIYEADVIVEGKEIELRISKDGKLVSRKVETEGEEKVGGKEGEDEGDEELGEDGEADRDEGAAGGEEEEGEKGVTEDELIAVAGKAALDKLGEAKVTLAEAIEAAIAQVRDGKAYAAVFKPEGGKPRYEVQVIAGDRLVEVVIDGITRRVIEVEPKGGKSARESAGQGGFRDSFQVDKANLMPTGKNDYFSLEPGHKLVFRGGKVTLTITVLDETKVVGDVTTRVIEEREEKDGKPLEISQNFFAIDKTTKDVYYFGEEVDDYKDGRLVGHEGAWLSGAKGARFGLLIPASPKVGDRFYQELAPGKAMDRAEIIAFDEEVVTPAGTFRCLHVKETSAIEKGASHKWYAPGVGLVRDDEFVLTEAPKVIGR